MSIEEMYGEQNGQAPQAAESSGQGAMDAVAGALRHASESLSAGHRGSGRLNPGEYGFLGRLTYRTSYGLSYGLVYPIVLLARKVPKENAAVYGLTDGAVAARDEAPKLLRGPGPAESTPAGEQPATAPQPA